MAKKETSSRETFHKLSARHSARILASHGYRDKYTRPKKESTRSTFRGGCNEIFHRICRPKLADVATVRTILGLLSMFHIFIFKQRRSDSIQIRNEANNSVRQNKIALYLRSIFFPTGESESVCMNNRKKLLKRRSMKIFVIAFGSACCQMICKVNKRSKCRSPLEKIAFVFANDELEFNAREISIETRPLNN